MATPKYGTLTLNRRGIISNQVLNFFYGSVSSSNLMSSGLIFTGTVPASKVLTVEELTPVMKSWESSSKAANVVVAYSPITDPYSPTIRANITPQEMQSLINGFSVSKLLE